MYKTHWFNDLNRENKSNNWNLHCVLPIHSLLIYLNHASVLHPYAPPSKHETLTQCCCNIGPPSSTLAQHYSNIGSTSLVEAGPCPFRAVRCMVCLNRLCGIRRCAFNSPSSCVKFHPVQTTPPLFRSRTVMSACQLKTGSNNTAGEYFPWLNTIYHDTSMIHQWQLGRNRSDTNRGAGSTLNQCWASVKDAGPALTRR